MYDLIAERNHTTHGFQLKQLVWNFNEMHTLKKSSPTKKLKKTSATNQEQHPNMQGVG